MVGWSYWQSHHSHASYKYWGVFLCVYLFFFKIKLILIYFLKMVSLGIFMFLVFSITFCMIYNNIYIYTHRLVGSFLQRFNLGLKEKVFLTFLMSNRKILAGWTIWGSNLSDLLLGVSSIPSIMLYSLMEFNCWLGVLPLWRCRSAIETIFIIWTSGMW